MTEQMTKEWSVGYIVEHWVRVISIAVLVFTGFYIHWPFMAGGPESFLMAWMRFFHFIAAYALVLGLFVRVYLSVYSTFDADWKDFVSLDNFKNLPDITKYYLFLSDSHKKYRKYTPLQAFAYLAVGALIVIMALTGGAIYHGRLFGFIPSPGSFQWVNSMLGGEPNTRLVHLAITWFFLIFVLIHVYMSFMMDWVNKDKTLSAIFTGYKLKKH